MTEEYVVDDLCSLRWQRRRMEQYNQICLQQRKDEVLLANKASKFMEKLRELAPEFLGATSFAAVTAILSRLSVSQGNYLMEMCPPNADSTQWGPEISQFLAELEPEKLLVGPDLFAAIVDPALMDLELARFNRLDEAIDRTIKRLMQIKAAKQVFPNLRKNAGLEPKLIGPPARAKERPARLVANGMKPATSAGGVVSAAPEEQSTAFIASVMIEGSRFDEGDPVSSDPIAAEQPALIAANDLEIVLPTAAVISAEQELDHDPLMVDYGMMVEESHADRGEPASVSSDPMATEQPALMLADELETVPPTEAVISAEPELDSDPFTDKDGVMVQQSHADQGEPASVSSNPIVTEQPALRLADELEIVHPTEAVMVPANQELERREFAAEAGVVPEESYIKEGEPSAVLSTPIAVEQPAVVAENLLKPASPTGTVISAKPEVESGFKTQSGTVVKEGWPPPALFDPAERLQFGILIGTVEISAEPMRFSVEELQAFSAFCNEEFRSNASNNQAGSPGAGAA